MTSGYRRFLVPGLSTLIMLAVLLGLGTWQVYRLQWKQGILAQLATAEAAAPVPLGESPVAYAKVSVTGRFRFDRTARFGSEVRDTSAGPTIGSYQIVPLERAGATTILVNRGWVPSERVNAINDPANDERDGDATIVGYIRPAEQPRWFSARDEVATRQFFTLDPQAIAAAVGVTDPAPFMLVALGPATTGMYPAPAQYLPHPPNNHLTYATIWYGLAVALLVIFAAWVRKAPRA